MFQKHADKVVTDTYLLRGLSAVMASLLIAFGLHSRLEADSGLPAPEIASTVWLNSCKCQSCHFPTE